MKQKCDLSKSDKKMMKEWKKQKAQEQAKEVGALLLCGLLNSFGGFGYMMYPMTKPSYVTPDDLFPSMKHK